MHAILSYRGNRPKHTQTEPITIHCTAASAQCKHFKTEICISDMCFNVVSCTVYSWSIWYDMYGLLTEKLFLI